MPGIDVAVLSEDFLVEAVCLSGLSGFVISSEEGDALRVLDLETEEIFDGLDGVVTTIDKITNEDVLVLREITALVEEFEHVEELSVDVTADVNGCAHRLHVRLLC